MTNVCTSAARPFLAVVAGLQWWSVEYTRGEEGHSKTRPVFRPANEYTLDNCECSRFFAFDPEHDDAKGSGG